jgi:murein DD-endopeptidase MepM/ murein hydrolase activator NlpD
MKWTIVFFNSSPSRRPVCFGAGWLLFVFICLALAAGVIGWGRMTFMAVHAFHCQRTLSKYRTDSTLIQTRLAFLDSQLESHRLKLKQLSDYEKTLRLNYGLKTIPDDVRKAGVGGLPSVEERSAEVIGGPIVKRVFDLEEDMGALLRQAAFEDSLLTESAVYIGRRHEQWVQTPSIRPAEGRLASRFGLRTDPMGGDDTRFHEGVDLANSIGTPIYAAADGIVRFAGIQGGFGTVVRVEHKAAGFETVYGHLYSYCVKEDQKVKRGERIGLMGSTGKSTGPHLHYEVRHSGKSLNPQPFILPESLIVD